MECDQAEDRPKIFVHENGRQQVQQVAVRGVAILDFFPSHFQVPTRVARWFIFKPKIQIWVNFRATCNRKLCYILWPFGQFSGHLVYFIALLYI
jgi:hypothetical protein